LIENNINGFEFVGGTDKYKEHSYCDYYESLFQNYLNTNANILEIGTFQGGWAFTVLSYLQDSKMTCIDIQNRFSDKLLSKIDGDRVKLIERNAYDLSIIQELINNKSVFDVIMEDGPHTVESQLFSIQNYTKLLKSGGLMIIEDIQSIEYLNVLIQSIDTQEYTYKTIDFRHIKNRWDDIILEIRKI